MFNLKTKLFLVASVLVLSGFSAANAQIADGTSIKVTVPTAFTLKDESFEAGVYTIERTPNTADSPSLLIIRDADGDAMIFDTMSSRAGAEAKATQLIFDTVGNTTYLTGIVVKGQSGKTEIVKTRKQADKMATETVSKRTYLTITDVASL